MCHKYAFMSICETAKNAWCILQLILEVRGNSTFDHDNREILQIHARCLGKSCL